MHIKDNSLSTILIPGQSQSFHFNEHSQSTSFLYYSNNDFAIMSYVDKGTVKLTVKDFKLSSSDSKVVERYLNEDSDAWSNVKVKNNDLEMYLVSV